MKIKAQKGFTLIELISAVLITLIMLLAAGTVLATSHNSWNIAWRKANLQRDASYAMLKMSHHIKAGTLAETEDNGTAIKIYKNTGDWIRFFLEQDNLKYELKEQAPETIISGSVEILDFDVDSNKATINLMLKKGNFATSLVSEIMLRNYGN